jgi:hypothetical protein
MCTERAIVSFSFALAVWAATASCLAEAPPATTETKGEWPAGYKPIEVPSVLGDVRFAVPSRWFRAGDKQYVGREALRNLKEETREWHYEFVAIANRALPVDSCIAQLNWYHGKLRVYAVPQRVQELQGKVLKLRDVEPKEIFPRRSDYRPHGIAVSYSPRFSMEHDASTDWRRFTITHSVRYGDYGGKSTVDIRTRQIGDKCLVFVFMHWYIRDSGKLIADVLGSVTISPPRETKKQSERGTAPDADKPRR